MTFFFFYFFSHEDEEEDLEEEEELCQTSRSTKLNSHNGEVYTIGKKCALKKSDRFTVINFKFTKKIMKY